MNKKIISVTLALVLLLSAAGCTSSEDAEDTTSQTQPPADELTVNWYNTAVAELNGQIYFLTDSRRDLYVMEEADGQPAARLVLEDLYANSIAAHGDYLYIYRCREEEQNSELYRYDPAQGGELEFLVDLIDEEHYWSWYRSADSMESSYMFLMGNYILVEASPQGTAIFLITGDAQQPISKENNLPNRYWNVILDMNIELSDDNDILQITDWREYSTSTPRRKVKYSNFDEDYFYFVIPGEGCYRNDYYPNANLNMRHWENIEEYFPNRYYAKLDIIGDWIYYNYGENGKARVNRHDLTRHEILLEG